MEERIERVPAVDDVSLALAARSDAHAFALLYERYVGPVYRFCYVRLGDQHRAEDATSEIFLKVLEGLRDYRGGHFPAWLFRIARNVVTDSYRRRKSSESLDVDPTVAGVTPGLEELAEARWDLETICGVLATFDEAKRNAVELRLAGWSWEQVADALGKSVDAARMLRTRALVELRAALEPAEPQSGRRNSERGR